MTFHQITTENKIITICWQIAEDICIITYFQILVNDVFELELLQ